MPTITLKCNISNTAYQAVTTATGLPEPGNYINSTGYGNDIESLKVILPKVLKNFIVSEWSRSHYADTWLKEFEVDKFYSAVSRASTDIALLALLNILLVLFKNALPDGVDTKTAFSDRCLQINATEMEAIRRLNIITSKNQFSVDAVFRGLDFKHFQRYQPTSWLPEDGATIRSRGNSPHQAEYPVPPASAIQPAIPKTRSVEATVRSNLEECELTTPTLEELSLFAVSKIRSFKDFRTSNLSLSCLDTMSPIPAEGLTSSATPDTRATSRSLSSSSPHLFSPVPSRTPITVLSVPLLNTPSVVQMDTENSAADSTKCPCAMM